MIDRDHVRMDRELSFRLAVRRARHVARTVHADLAHPPFRPAGHYYSPRTSGQDIERALKSKREPIGVNLRADEQLTLARKLDLRIPDQNRWSLHSENNMFHSADAAVYRAMLLNARPRRVVEIGSGYSTALALDLAEKELPELQITCIEPYADRLRSRLRPGDQDRLTLIERPVQDVDPAELVAGLEPGDIFFIDSTHVVKAGSDVLWLMLHTLPLLPAGVLVHIHDIHWPFEYPETWLREQRDWTEVYLVHAFLIGNSEWRIELFSDWLISVHPELVPELRGISAGSLWLVRNR